MLTMIIVAAAASTIQPLPVASVWGANIDRRVLHAALRAPERSRTGKETRYCFIDDVTVRGQMRTVCRSRRDWNRNGLDPVI